MDLIHTHVPNARNILLSLLAGNYTFSWLKQMYPGFFFYTKDQTQWILRLWDKCLPKIDGSVKIDALRKAVSSQRWETIVYDVSESLNCNWASRTGVLKSRSAFVMDDYGESKLTHYDWENADKLFVSLMRGTNWKVGTGIDCCYISDRKFTSECHLNSLGMTWWLIGDPCFPSNIFKTVQLVDVLFNLSKERIN